MNVTDFDIQPTSYGQRIELPDRDLGDATVFGWVVIAFGAIITLFMMGWIGGPAAIGIGMVLQGEWFGWLIAGFGLLGLSGLFVGLKILAAGIAIVRNRFGCEIRITDSTIISREKFGWFHHDIKFDREKIDSLYPRSVIEPDNDKDTVQIDWIASRLPDDLQGIGTEPRRGKMLAACYPPEILLPLADILKSELDCNRVGLVSIVHHQNDSSVASCIEKPISIVQHAEEEVEAVPVELPTDSTIEVIDQSDAKVYRVPAQGVWKGSHGLMAFALIWNGFMTFVTIGMLAGGGQAGQDLWVMVVMLSIFWAVGIGLVVAALYLGRQSSLVGIRDGLLFIERKTIFGTKWMDFEAGKIASIQMGASNMEVNDVPVMELKIQPVGESPVGMFSQLEEAEIRWLAKQLSNELSLEPQTRESWRRYVDPEGSLNLPETSLVSVERANDQQMTITIPPKNVEGHWTLLVMGIVFTFGSLPTAIACMLNFNADWIVVPIAMIGTLTGVAMWIADRLYSTRWFQLNVSKSQIKFERHGFLSARTGAISRENFRSVSMKDSGAKVNGRTYMHLVVESRLPSETFTLMSGRDEREIACIAGLIHHAMAGKPNIPESDSAKLGTDSNLFEIDSVLATPVASYSAGK